MAISEQSPDQLLTRFEAELENDEWEQRLIYQTASFAAWFDTVLRTEQNSTSAALFPEEQIEALFRHFILGRPMVFGVNLKKLQPLGNHIWAMKTTDTRVFGFFYRKSTFVAVAGAMKHRVPQFHAYTPYLAEVAAVMTTLPLPPPPCVTGVKINDVA